MSLTTLDKIRTFHRTLYCKTKAEPAFRLYVLYDKIWREDLPGRDAMGWPAPMRVQLATRASRHGEAGDRVSAQDATSAATSSHVSEF
jgi:hypothetical protein